MHLPNYKKKGHLALHISMTEIGVDPFNLKKYSSKIGILKIQNLKHE